MGVVVTMCVGWHSVGLAQGTEDVANPRPPGSADVRTGAQVAPVSTVASTPTEVRIVSQAAPLQVATPTEPSGPEVDDIRGGALASLGIVAGISLSSTVITNPAIEPLPTAMPYVGFLPFIWLTRGAESTAYCARALWLGPFPGDPQRHADELAVQRTAEIRRRAGEQELSTTDVGALTERDKSWILEATGWEIGTRARCGAGQGFGFYVGVPLGQETTVRYIEGGAQRQTAGVVSVGLMFALPPFLTILAGWSLLAVPSFDESRTEYRDGLLFGLGTSLDLIDFLLDL
jgi:hypothetical protein